MTNACKLLFKLSREEKNDKMFREEDMGPVLVRVLTSSNRAEQTEGLIYCCGVLKNLSFDGESSAHACHFALTLLLCCRQRTALARAARRRARPSRAAQQHPRLGNATRFVYKNKIKRREEEEEGRKEFDAISSLDSPRSTAASCPTTRIISWPRFARGGRAHHSCLAHTVFLISSSSSPPPPPPPFFSLLFWAAGDSSPAQFCGGQQPPQGIP